MFCSANAREIAVNFDFIVILYRIQHILFLSTISLLLLQIYLRWTQKNVPNAITF